MVNKKKTKKASRKSIQFNGEHVQIIIITLQTGNYFALS